MGFRLAGDEVVLVETRKPLKFRLRHGYVIGPAGLARCIVLIDRRELADAVVQLALLHLAGLHVHAPFDGHGIEGQHIHHGGIGAIGGVGRIAVRHHHAGGHDHLIAILPGIDDVIDVAAVGLEPADLVTAARARDDAETGGLIGEMDLPHRPLQPTLAKDHGQVVQDDEVFRQPHVVGQAGARQVDLLEMGQPVVGTDRPERHPGFVERIVEKDELARHRIDLGMGRDVAGQGSAEVLHADGFKGAGVDADRLARDVPQPHQAAVVQDDVRIGGVLVDPVTPCGGRVGAGRGVEDAARPTAAVEVCDVVGRLDESVAVPRLAVLEPDGVKHAVAIEPVMQALRRGGRVGAVTIEGPVEIERNFADHRQVIGGRFPRDRLVSTLNIRVQQVEIGQVSGLDTACDRRVVGHGRTPDSVVR